MAVLHAPYWVLTVPLGGVGAELPTTPASLAMP